MHFIDRDSRFCRALAVGAWLALVAWYGVAYGGSWGTPSAAFFWWTPPALLLAAATRHWLQRAGRPAPPRPLAFAAVTWAVGMAAVLSVGGWPWRAGTPAAALTTASNAIPTLITALAIWASVRRTRPAA